MVEANNGASLKVLSITLLKSKGHPDVALIEVDLPSAIYPFIGNQGIKMDIAFGDGEKYLTAHFPNMKIKVINHE